MLPRTLDDVRESQRKLVAIISDDEYEAEYFNDLHELVAAIAQGAMPVALAKEACQITIGLAR